VYHIICTRFSGCIVGHVVVSSKVNNMEIVDDSGFDSDHKTSASVPMAEESELNKIGEVCCVYFYICIILLIWNEYCFAGAISHYIALIMSQPSFSCTVNTLPACKAVPMRVRMRNLVIFNN